MLVNTEKRNVAQRMIYYRTQTNYGTSMATDNIVLMAKLWVTLASENQSTESTQLRGCWH